MPIEEYESDDGVVVKEHDGQGPNFYSVYHRTEKDPYVTADRVEVDGSAAIVYGKLLLFGKVRVETYPDKGETWARITPLDD